MRQSEQEIVDAGISLLERFRSCLGLYIGRDEVRATESLLSGFRMGFAATGIRLVDDAHWRVWVDRGWKVEATGPIPQMQSETMDTHTIIHELVEIEIKVLRRYTVRGESRQGGS